MADYQDQEFTPFGRPVGFVAPKPLSPRCIAKLGDALDRAERACSAAWLVTGAGIRSRPTRCRASVTMRSVIAATRPSLTTFARSTPAPSSQNASWRMRRAHRRAAPGSNSAMPCSPRGRTSKRSKRPAKTSRPSASASTRELPLISPSGCMKSRSRNIRAPSVSRGSLALVAARALDAPFS
jgi:hypothetical protein